jgi:TPM domain
MIRAVVLVLVLVTTILAKGQDSTYVKEYCSKLGQLSETTDIESQISEIDELTKKYLERKPLTGGNPIQEVLRLQYRLSRELKRSCPNYTADRVRLIPKAVYDLENKLTKQQVDSLSTLTEHIKRDKKVYLYLVTIDDFYPDSTITDFANRYREFWAPRTIPENGVVLVVFSTALRQVRISTSDESMAHLNDRECDEAINAMISQLKNGDHFAGLVEGLIAIKSRL